MSWWPFGWKREFMAKIDDLTAEVGLVVTLVPQVVAEVQSLKDQITALQAQIAATGGASDAQLEALRAQLADSQAKLAALIPAPATPAP